MCIDCDAERVRIHNIVEHGIVENPPPAEAQRIVSIRRNLLPADLPADMAERIHSIEPCDICGNDVIVSTDVVAAFANITLPPSMCMECAIDVVSTHDVCGNEDRRN